LKRFFASAALIAIAAIGVPVVATAAASAAPPSPRDNWMKLCNGKDASGFVDTVGGVTTYDCSTPDNGKSARFETFCRAVHGEYAEYYGIAGRVQHVCIA